MELFEIPHRNKMLDENERRKVGTVLEELRAQGYAFTYDDTSHANESRITLSVGGKERTIHLTNTSDIVHRFADAVKATIMYPEDTLAEGLRKIASQD